MTRRACQCQTDWLKRHIEGRLDEREQDRLASHIESCEECRNALDALAADESLWRDLRAFLAHESPFTSAVPRQLRKSEGDPQAHGSRQEWTRREAALTVLDPPTDSSCIGSLGPYQILEVIGRGGMGLVLKGLDPVLRRVVAIKVLVPELSYLGSARLRFAREARAAASVAHEHVVAIHAVESAKGLPYLVMQYVAGNSLQQRIEQSGPLGIQEVLRIGMQTASGLAAAHAQGLVHRDIKPANILLENGIERVRITDFGLARAADDASLSQSGVVAGTPHYMSPEQARCEPIDHRADLFGLGSVMYAMCTGHPPFRGRTAMAVLRGVCDDRPRPIRTVRSDVPAWLEGIIAKLLAKHPAARFQTAAEVATLLGQCLVYLEHPTDAPPFPAQADRRLEHVRGWRTAASAVIVFVAGIAMAVVANRIVALDPWIGSTARRLDASSAASTSLQVASAAFDALRPVPLSCRDPVTPWPLGAVSTAAFSPNGTELAVGCADGSVALCSTSNYRLRAILGKHPERVWSLAYSPDGSMLAAAGGDSERDTREGFVSLWSVATGRELVRLAHACETELAVAFSPSGKTLAWGGRDQLVKLWDTESGHVRALCRGHEGTIRALAFHPREERLVSVACDATIRVWNTATGEQDGQPIRLAGHSANCVAMAPDGSTFATATGPGSDDPGWRNPAPGLLQVWTWTTRKQKFVLEGHRDPILGVSFSPDGCTLASAGGRFADGGEVKLWDTLSGSEHVNLAGHKWPVECVAFSPDSRSLVSAGGFEKRGGEVRIWDLSLPVKPGDG